MAAHALGLTEADAPGYTEWVGGGLGYGTGTANTAEPVAIVPMRQNWEIDQMWPLHGDPARVLTCLHSLKKKKNWRK